MAGAASAAFTVWLQTGGTLGLVDLVDEALAFARSGYAGVAGSPDA